MTELLNQYTAVSFIQALFVIGITWRVIMRRPPAGVAFAWLFLVAILPIGGAMIYLLIGEHRIGRQRANRIDQLRAGR